LRNNDSHPFILFNFYIRTGKLVGRRFSEKFSHFGKCQNLYFFAQDNPAAALPLLATLGASALAAPQLHGGAAIIV